MLGRAVFKNLIAIHFHLLQLCHSVPSPVFTPALFQLGMFRFCSICCIVQLPVAEFALMSVFCEDEELSARVVIYLLLFTLQETFDFVRHLSDYVDGLTDRPPTPSLVKGVLVDIRLTREIEKW